MSPSLEDLWSTYSRNLQEFIHSHEHLRQYSRSLEDCFLCPLCLKQFGRVPNLSEIVAREHIIPRSLGGRLVTLTCKSCNNSDGTRIESDLVQRVLLDARKRYPLAGVEIGGAKIRAEFRVPQGDDDVIEIVVLGKQSDPRQEEKARRSLTEEDWVGRSFQVNLEFGYNERRSDVALMRSAYLYMFWALGYMYVLDTSARFIRELLCDPFRDSLAFVGVQRHSAIDLPTDLCFTMASEPSELRDSILVFLRLDKSSEQIASVALPPERCEGEEFYRRLKKFGNNVKYEGWYTRSLLDGGSEAMQ